MARVTLGYDHYAICNDTSQLVTTGRKVNGCEGASHKLTRPLVLAFLRISTPLKFQISSLHPFL